MFSRKPLHVHYAGTRPDHAKSKSKSRSVSFSTAPAVPSKMPAANACLRCFSTSIFSSIVSTVVKRYTNTGLARTNETPGFDS